MSNTALRTDESFYGWDMLYRTIEGSVRKSADILVALTHYILTKEGNMLCIGVGDSKILTQEDDGSELMPNNWNSAENIYALRYTNNNQLYLVLGHTIEGSIILNMMNVTKKTVANICFDIDEVVKKCKGNLFEMIPTATDITDRIRKELVKPVFPGYTTERQTQTVENPEHQYQRPRESDPLRLYPPEVRPIGYDPNEDRPPTFPSIGRGDVDPLARGPGNLFEHPQRPNIRGGARPRYDPMGPPDSNTRPNPNPDNFQPPGFGGRPYPPF